MTRIAKNADCLLVVPMKDPAASKTRLSATLPAGERRRLARLLFRQTLTVLLQTRKSAPFDLAVVTGSEEATAIAQEMGVGVISEGHETTLTGAVSEAADWAAAQGYASLCIVPADLAAPDPRDVERLITTGLRDKRALICPSTDLGTNALFVAPPTAMPFAYGPRSATRHLENAERAGLNPALLPLESLRFDIDTSACLERAMREVPGLPRALNAR